MTIRCTCNTFKRQGTVGDETMHDLHILGLCRIHDKVELGIDYITTEIPKLIALEKNWDGYGADPIDSKSLTWVGMILGTLTLNGYVDRDLEFPTISLDVNGWVMIEFEDGDGNLIIGVECLPDKLMVVYENGDIDSFEPIEYPTVIEMIEAHLND